MTVAALKVTTPEGECFALFPNDSQECELKGLSESAIAYFTERLPMMFREHGFPIDLTLIEPEDFLAYCDRPDLGIAVTSEFSQDELDLIMI